MRRLLCILLRHPLVPVSFVSVDPAFPRVALAVRARRCRCGAEQQVDYASVSQFPRVRS